MPLEVQGRALPFWLPPINISEVPDCHGCYSALNISQAMLKIVFLLVSYHKRLKTNEQDCTYRIPVFSVFHLIFFSERDTLNQFIQKLEDKNTWED